MYVLPPFDFAFVPVHERAAGHLNARKHAPVLEHTQLATYATTTTAMNTNTKVRRPPPVPVNSAAAGLPLP